MNNFSNIIAKALHIGEPYVLNTLALIDEGATIPFISRYRKEKTGAGAYRMRPYSLGKANTATIIHNRQAA